MGMDKPYYINFDTKEIPGRMKAIRVRLDTEIISDLDRPLSINLCDHPLYPDLVRYVQANPPGGKKA